MSKETERKCLYCQKTRSWIWSGRKLKDGSKVYYDKENRRWGGKRCPTCEKNRIKTSLKYDKFKKEAVKEELQKKGFKLKEGTFSFLVEKDQQEYTVRMLQAGISEGQVLIDKDYDKSSCDLFALIFQTVRIVSKEQIEAIVSSKN